jgi:hypothetical protein
LWPGAASAVTWFFEVDSGIGDGFCPGGEEAGFEHGGRGMEIWAKARLRNNLAVLI